jgi:7-carboxy-7-deazaguanine synthase
MIKVNEFFKSIQGESTRAGMICFFIRLTGCNLSCEYCDTQYALDEGFDYTIEEIIKRVTDSGTSFVEITGGEPLLQKETPLLCRKLLEAGYTVLVETNGTQDISALPDGCIRIIDVKCPGSESSIPFLEENISHIQLSDECKMVISSYDDFMWALNFINGHNLSSMCTVIFSPNVKKVSVKELATWILEADAPVRLGLQLHKHIWGDAERGV